MVYVNLQGNSVIIYNRCIDLDVIVREDGQVNLVKKIV